MPNAARLSSRAVLKVGGPDAPGFLQNLVTQDVENLAPGVAAFTALLTPQGKILFDFFVVRDGDNYLVDCAAESADALAKRLTLYRLRAKVTIERTDLSVAVFWGEQARGAEGSEVIQFGDPRLDALGVRAIGRSLEGASEADYDAHRIALSVPEFGKDFAGDAMFLLDVNYDALSGVSYAKGCFVGQEVTSRMKRKGEIRRRTLKLAFEGAPPEKGTPVTAGESTLGEVLSGSDGAALALIRLDRWAAAQEAVAEIVADRRPVHLSVPGYLEQR